MSDMFYMSRYQFLAHIITIITATIIQEDGHIMVVRMHMAEAPMALMVNIIVLDLHVMVDLVAISEIIVIMVVVVVALVLALDIVEVLHIVQEVEGLVNNKC